jgi:tRNA-dihydrouridine synthase 4
MIIAREFSRSELGRRSDFSTSAFERGTFWLNEISHDPYAGEGRTKRRRLVRGALIAQFAANDAKIFADASELIFPHVDGIDLNLGKLVYLTYRLRKYGNIGSQSYHITGCPQKWAYQEKIGSYLLRQPNQVYYI